MTEYITLVMDTPRTKPCPCCGSCDPDCLGCDGAGEVPVDSEVCPRCHGDRRWGPLPCWSCGGRGLVDGDDADEIRWQLDEEAWEQREDRAGRHWSGVPLRGPF